MLMLYSTIIIKLRMKHIKPAKKKKKKKNQNCHRIKLYFLTLRKQNKLCCINTIMNNKISVKWSFLYIVNANNNIRRTT